MRKFTNLPFLVHGGHVWRTVVCGGGVAHTAMGGVVGEVVGGAKGGSVAIGQL